jgi:hypothetical protein
MNWLLLGSCLLAMPALAGAAQAAAGPKRTAPAVKARDLSGVWMNDNTLDERLKREGRTRLSVSESSAPPPPDESVLTPEYRAVYQEMKTRAAKLAEGAQACSWPGMPYIMTYPYPFEVIHSPGRITFLFEAESQVRRIFLDRKSHLPEDDLDPSYNGDSIGRWEGETLVIDTVGFNTLTTVRGLPHSEEMRIMERIRFTAKDTIENEITITDPKAFVRPIVQKAVYSRRPNWRIREYTCNENNRDHPDADGARSGGTVR